MPAKCGRVAGSNVGCAAKHGSGSRELKDGRKGNEEGGTCSGVSRGCTWVCVQRRDFIAGVEPAVRPSWLTRMSRQHRTRYLDFGPSTTPIAVQRQ